MNQLVIEPRQETTESVVITPIQLLSKAIEKNLPIDQLEKLMDLQERWEKKQAEKSYNDAMSIVQKEIHAVKAKLQNKQTNSKYAGIVDIDAVIRPQYTANGIAISFDTDASPLPEHVRIVAFVTHKDGHKETRHIDIPADGKGAKGGDVMTKTHAVMSATTYGQRALLKMIFNIATGEFDDDGNAAFGQLSKEEIEELQLAKIAEMSAELDSHLTDNDKSRLKDIVTKKEVASYQKAIALLKKKQDAINKATTKP